MKEVKIPYQCFLRNSFLSLFVFFSILGFANDKDVLVLDDSLDKIHLADYVTVYDTSVWVSPEDMWAVSQNANVFHSVKSTSFGFSTHYYWIKVQLLNESDKEMETVIVVNNPHIDYLEAWEITLDNAIQSIYVGGDALAFGKRTFKNRNLVIPVKLVSHKPKTVLLMVDKRNASVSVPMTLKKRIDFEKQEKNEHLFYGMYFGILLVIIVFALFVFSVLREIIFFWYAFYIFFLGIYLMAHIGLLFQIGYPDFNAFNDYSRPFFITLSTSALIQFIRLLLNVKQLLPRINPIFTYVIVVLNATTFWWILTPFWHDNQTIVYLNIQNFTLLFALVLVLVSSIITFKQQRVVVAFFWIAFMAILGAGLFIILIESGLINENVVAVNPLFIGSLIEVIVFAMGLSYWTKINENDRLKLVNLVQKSKKQMVDAYVNGIESEKQKISSDLHDDIGSRLSHLKRLSEEDYKDYPEIIQGFERVTNKVRSLSHELAPPLFAKNEFLVSIKYLVLSHESPELEISLQIFDIPDNLDEYITKHLYRIVQSALGNVAQPHSKVTAVDIQFFYYNNELVLAMEDNGTGSVFTKDNPGMAFKEIKSRVKSINGTIDISSTNNRGTSIMITVKV